MQIDFVFQIAVLIMSVVVHEVSHGYAASLLGDQTARYQGRLSLNPLRHLDPFGSVILPFLLYITNAGFIFGWARPVPYNPYNLKPGRWSEAKVALAGPVSNIVIAVIFGFLLRFGIAESFFGTAGVQLTALIVFINILLAVFNMVPIPPLDGSKVLYALFPAKLFQMREFFERYGLLLVILFIFFLWSFIAPITFWFFKLITGLNL